MINRRDLFLLLVPFCAVGGAVLRTVERVRASPITPERYRQSFNHYLWTDGTNWWRSGYDAPPGAKILWHGYLLS